MNKAANNTPSILTPVIPEVIDPAETIKRIESKADETLNGSTIDRDHVLAELKNTINHILEQTRIVTECTSKAAKLSEQYGFEKGARQSIDITFTVTDGEELQIKDVILNEVAKARIALAEARKDAICLSGKECEPNNEILNKKEPIKKTIRLTLLNKIKSLNPNLEVEQPYKTPSTTPHKQYNSLSDEYLMIMANVQDEILPKILKKLDNLSEKLDKLTNQKQINGEIAIARVVEFSLTDIFDCLARCDENIDSAVKSSKNVKSSLLEGFEINKKLQIASPDHEIDAPKKLLPSDIICIGNHPEKNVNVFLGNGDIPRIFNPDTIIMITGYIELNPNRLILQSEKGEFLLINGRKERKELIEKIKLELPEVIESIED